MQKKNPTYCEKSPIYCANSPINRGKVRILVLIDQVVSLSRAYSRSHSLARVLSLALTLSRAFSFAHALSLSVTRTLSLGLPYAPRIHC